MSDDLSFASVICSVSCVEDTSRAYNESFIECTTHASIRRKSSRDKQPYLACQSEGGMRVDTHSFRDPFPCA